MVPSLVGPRPTSFCVQVPIMRLCVQCFFPVLAGSGPVGHDDECSRALRFSLFKVLLSLAAAHSWKPVRGPAGNTASSLDKCCVSGWMWRQILVMEASQLVSISAYGIYRQGLHPSLVLLSQVSPPFVCSLLFSPHSAATHP